MDKNIKQAIFANGCFWCTEAVFQRLEGVVDVVSGYTGGHVKNPAYREVCNGTTGHAEAIRIDFDSKVISYQTLLEVFFATHNPTTLNRQGNDIGTQYRSAIFYVDESQKNQANDFIQSLTKACVFQDSIVTQLDSLGVFYLAEATHNNYYNQNKEQAYCQFTITPKIEKIQQFFAEKLKQN
jgi:peptide-methionine (S)-S-oxide reductase